MSATLSNTLKRFWLILASLTGLMATTVDVRADDVQIVAAGIRAAATQPEEGPDGRPLPLATFWCTGNHRFSHGYAPAAQIKLIEQGHYILPAFYLHDSEDMDSNGFVFLKTSTLSFSDYYEQPMKRVAELKLPFSLVSTQWEYLLSKEPYLSLPADQNPNVVTADGKVRPEVCPFGPLELWREIGQKWTRSAAIRRLQEWCPDPPRVIFLSNNEHPKLTWPKAEESKRYLAIYGKGHDDDFKRKAVGDGWIERYRALQSAMREGLSSHGWRKKSIFVGYDAFGPGHFGRWAGWPEYTLHSPGRFDPSSLMWDGGSPSYYTHDWCPITDYTVWSPQIESMNWLFMLDQARKSNPNFWFELSIWDGSDGDDPGRKTLAKSTTYIKAGQTYSPDRYAGFVQFGMWLLRPRAVREFRGWVYSWDKGGPYFLAICGAVDRVHTNPVLRTFWQHGKLVANRTAKHPYQENIPAEYKDVDRWFLLDTDVMPPRPWKLDTPIPAFAVTLEKGEAPNRQWLHYAHAPTGECRNVKIVIPKVKAVTVDVPVAGAFFLVDEKTESVTEVSHP